MCGICGVVSEDASLISTSTLDRMAAAIRHRGPDDAGIWTSTSSSPGVGLAHRRLSIIDLSSAGHQPMTNEDGSMWLTYNGEIYNHADIRKPLENAGHVYRSHTDSETILHAFEEWGDRAVEQFRGMFAFALWDQRRRRLTLCRDRLGIKPLYYAQSAGSLVFASEIKSILASGLIAAAPAEGAISEYLAFGYVAGANTMFRGIRQVPPGHMLIWENGRIRIEPYWQLTFRPDRATPPEEMTRRFGALFDEAVRLRLMSDVPLGVFLSGGLDSSAIATVMKPHVTGALKTFSVGYEDTYYSEFSYAREVARAIGADHHEVILKRDEFFDALPRLIWHEDEPLWGTASVALYFVSALAAKEVTVVLTGEGSDELFAGYDRYWMTALNARALRLYGRLPRALRTTFKRALGSEIVPERLRRALSHTFVQQDSMPDGLILDNWFGIIPPAWQQAVAGPALQRELSTTDAYASRRGIFDEVPETELVDRFLYLDIKSSLVELLMKQDQMSMATSIESRVPFLDHKLVEFAATVPAELKISGTSGKHIVKNALRDVLPASILTRKKMGFPVPWEEWLRESLLTRVESLLLEERSLDRGWITAAGVRSIVDEHRSGRRNLSRQLWALLGLETWARVFIDQPQQARPEPAVRAARFQTVGAAR